MMFFIELEAKKTKNYLFYMHHVWGTMSGSWEHNRYILHINSKHVCQPQALTYQDIMGCHGLPEDGHP
jgi:hypothetical protein